MKQMLEEMKQMLEGMKRMLKERIWLYLGLAICVAHMVGWPDSVSFLFK